MITPDDCYTKVGPYTVHYWQAGSQGSPVVLVHGLSGNVDNWLPCFDALAAQHRVYALDLLGHGRTDKPLDASYKLADLARLVRDFMIAVQIPRAHMVGHSLGGGTVLTFALHYPEMVDRLVPVSAGGLGPEVTFFLRLMSLPLIGELLSRPARPTAKGMSLFVFDPSVITPEFLERDYQQSLIPGRAQAVLRTLRANCSILGQRREVYAPILAGLPKLIMPVLFLWGREDQLVPVKHAEAAVKHLPNARLHVFEHCGHVPMLEHTEAFNRVLVDFLKD